MPVRCKFVCISKREYKDYSSPALVYDYEFNAVTGGQNSSEENKTFWKYTPSGKLNVSTVNDGSFVVGQEYYLDISPAVFPVPAV
ncbi:hypothetical protein LLG88_13755 [bacterium]|nr:hypothetical protein [bacterium]